jgi:hypothetical protein
VNPSKTYRVEVKGIRDGKFTLDTTLSQTGRRTAFTHPEVEVKKETRAQFTMDADKGTGLPPSLSVVTAGRTSSVAARSTIPPPLPAIIPGAEPQAGASAGRSDGYDLEPDEWGGAILMLVPLLGGGLCLFVVGPSVLVVTLQFVRSKRVRA